MSLPRAMLIPPGAALAPAFAEALIARRRAQLPDLSNDWLLLPAAMPVRPVRAALAAAAGGALLGPRVDSLARFAANHRDQTALPAFEARLLLVDALRRRRGGPFAEQDPWQLADALYEIFEALAAEGAALPEDDEAFEQQLVQAYGGRPLAALSREARIVHQLWRAWLVASEGRSAAQLQARALQQACAALPAGVHLHLLGHDSLAGAERAALKPLLDAGRATLWLHGRIDGRDGAALQRLCAQLGLTPEPLAAGDGPRSAFLDAAFALPQSQTGGRAAQLALSVAEGPEHEARCVDLRVREALLAGAQDIVVVTEDRRLARRLRALLERAGVVLDDEIGWALATSAAAATLHNWLEALSSGFRFRPLLGLLKSAFVDAEPHAVSRLERELVYRRGVEAGLERFLAHTQDASLRALLQRLQQAAALLPGLREPRAGGDWLRGLRRSLDTLGLTQAFAADEAGRVLLGVLDELTAGFAALPLQQSWAELRALLDRAFEAATFRPQREGRVRLLTLDRVAGLRCELLILAGATRGRLPAPPAGETFFNQSVRTELGLPTALDRQQLALARLRRALEAADQVHVTWGADAPDEPAQPSPWIEALEHAATRTGQTLRDEQLPRRAGTAAVEVAQPAPLPAEPRTKPAPVAPLALLPQRLSATMHQALIDCPYLFFARGALALHEETAPDEDPDRSDYGARVHRILEAFTQPVDALPGPFGAPVTAANRDGAEALLREIAEAVFAPDLRERALAHVWRTEFLSLLPGLLDWLAARPAVPAQAEHAMSRALDERWTLEGRIDRIEEIGPGARAVIDYKTGRTLPRKDELQSGEAVQLTHYALIDTQIESVEYLGLGEDMKTLRLDGEALGDTRAAVGERLDALLDALNRWAPLPALGDDTACARCDYAGLCRKRDWHPPAPGAPA